MITLTYIQLVICLLLYSIIGAAVYVLLHINVKSAVKHRRTPRFFDHYFSWKIAGSSIAFLFFLIPTLLFLIGRTVGQVFKYVKLLRKHRSYTFYDKIGPHQRTLSVKKGSDKLYLTECGFSLTVPEYIERINKKYDGEVRDAYIADIQGIAEKEGIQ